MEFYRILGIILIAIGAFDMVVLPRLFSRIKDEEKTPVITSVIWIFALGTMLFGLLCFLGVFGEF